MQGIYDAENQMVNALPLMIQECTNEDLRIGLSEHLEETKEQVNRLQKVFSLLGEIPEGKKCKGMAGIIEEGKDILSRGGLTPAVKDCFIIITAQQVEHFEIASYGSAVALIEHIQSACPEKNEFNEICDLLEETLQEEGKADKALTRVAEGKLFFDGVNDELEKEIKLRR